MEMMDTEPAALGLDLISCSHQPEACNKPPDLTSNSAPTPNQEMRGATTTRRTVSLLPAAHPQLQAEGPRCASSAARRPVFAVVAAPYRSVVVVMTLPTIRI